MLKRKKIGLITGYYEWEKELKNYFKKYFLNLFLLKKIF
jgi:hypothetical protein